MKFKLAALGILLVLIASMTACSSANIQVRFSCDDFTNEQHITHHINASPGDIVEITLCANPSTGFEWGGVKISDESTLKLTDRNFHAPGSADGSQAPGTAGEEVFIFKAFKQGSSTVTIEYGRPWDGDEKGVWTYEMTVTVK